MVCYGDGECRISAECGKEHYYCSDCVVGSLQSMLESGQLPLRCPGCRSDATTLAGGQDEEGMGGLITDEALGFLATRGVLPQQTRVRLLNAAARSEQPPTDADAAPRAAAPRAAATGAFACPDDCGRFLLGAHPSYAPSGARAEVGLGEMLCRRGAGALRLGVCECGALVCGACQARIPPDEADGHLCKQGGEAIDAASQALLATVCKPCPGCGLLMQKTEGCQLIMCGTVAHGKVADALRNGGCAYVWHWDTLEAVIDDHGYTGLDGKKHVGEGPVTERQTRSNYLEALSDAERARAEAARKAAAKAARNSRR